MMQQHSCMCLLCGRAFQIVLEPEADISKQKCPICGGGNVVKHNPSSFLNSLFGSGGG